MLQAASDSQRKINFRLNLVFLCHYLLLLPFYPCSDSVSEGDNERESFAACGNNKKQQGLHCEVSICNKRNRALVLPSDVQERKTEAGLNGILTKWFRFCKLQPCSL